MEYEYVVPTILLFVTSIALILTGIFFGVNASGTPLWLYFPGLTLMGGLVGIGAIASYKDMVTR